MFRQNANTGAFSGLPEKMSKAHIREVARKFNVDIKGLTLKLDLNEELLKSPITGLAVPERIGEIMFFPNAFESEEMVIRTLYHEKIHVEQFKKYGGECVQNNLQRFEAEAYAAESEFIEKLKKEGRL